VSDLPAPLTLPDLGVTVSANADGTASIDLGWFGSKTLTPADMAALEAWIASVKAVSSSS
jgi:hypothetical protein